MEVRTLYLDHDKAPVSGLALYVVVSQENRRAVVLHPITLTKFEVNADDFLRATEYPSSVQFWPTNASGSKFSPLSLAELMERKMQDFSKRGKDFPGHIVRGCIAQLRGIDVADVPIYKTTTAPRGFAVRSEKRPGIIDHIVEMLDKGATVEEMVASLKAKFPDRNADGMKTTVRCQINRLPGKLARKMVVKDDKKRGKIYKLA